MNELQSKLITALNDVLLPLGMNYEKLENGAKWGLPGEYPLCWHNIGMGYGVELEAETSRWSGKPTGTYCLTIAGLRKIDFKGLPSRILESIDSIESPQFKQGLRFAVNRVKAVKLDIAARATKQERANAELAALRAAVQTARFPDFCWKPHDRKRLRDTPVLICNELRLEVNEQFTLTAESAAKLFAILGDGATLEIKLDKKLTPAQWVEYLRWQDADGGK